jgi:hypothetical protein
MPVAMQSQRASGKFLNKFMHMLLEYQIFKRLSFNKSPSSAKL